MAGLKKRIASATLIENLVALVIISLCLSIALVILAKVSGDINQQEHQQWLNQVKELSEQTHSNNAVLPSQFEELQLVQSTNIDSNYKGVSLKKLIPYEY